MSDGSSSTPSPRELPEQSGAVAVTVREQDESGGEPAGSHLRPPSNLAQGVINGLPIELACRLFEQSGEVSLITLVASAVQRALRTVTLIGSVVAFVGSPITLVGMLVSSMHWQQA